MQKLAEIHTHGFGEAPGTSAVVFGSFAREEVTAASDLDWTLLIDGPADSQHFRIARNLGDAYQQANYRDPAAQGPFRDMTSSHELVHHIGLDDDTNHNLTRRMLLLLESKPVGDPVLHEGVVRAILDRYLGRERTIVLEEGKPRVPRFLLNDIVRFWRTMAVDYAAKQWRQNKKWALRNAKLRFSRKLLYAAGLLLCFKCELNYRPSGVLPASIFPDDPDPDTELVEYVFRQSRSTPLDALASALLANDVSFSTARSCLESYDQFLAILDDENKRKYLEELPRTHCASDELFGEVRELSRTFQAGLDHLFLESKLAETTLKYGIF